MRNWAFIESLEELNNAMTHRITPKRYIGEQLASVNEGKIKMPVPDW